MAKTTQVMKLKSHMKTEKKISSELNAKLRESEKKIKKMDEKQLIAKIRQLVTENTYQCEVHPRSSGYGFTVVINYAWDQEMSVTVNTMFLQEECIIDTSGLPTVGRIDFSPIVLANYEIGCICDRVYILASKDGGDEQEYLEKLISAAHELEDEPLSERDKAARAFRRYH